MDANTARTVNMRRLVADAGGPTAWAEKYGGARWSQVLASQWISETSPKGIGRKLARSLEVAQGLSDGSLDWPPNESQSQSQSVGFDLAKLDASIRFLRDLFAAHGKAFVTDDQLPLVLRVYDELRTTATPNLVEMTFRYGKGFDDERQGKAGSAGKGDRGADEESARTAKIAIGRKG
jgi:hypothetical protein